MRKAALTPADAVVLSLLEERPMHGYELNRELESREVQDWAGVSRPQVYYSLKKLAARRFVIPVTSEDSAGPERTVYRVSAAGRRALEATLAREDWTTRRDPPPFLTWLALSTHAPRAVVRRQLERRRVFLQAQLERERNTLEDVRRDTGEMVPVAELMLELVIRQFEAELAWLTAVEARILPS